MRFLSIYYKKHDIVTQRVHTKIHFTKLLFTGEEFMVLENIIGEKFMIPWKNIHPWIACYVRTILESHFRFSSPVQFCALAQIRSTPEVDTF